MRVVMRCKERLTAANFQSIMAWRDITAMCFLSQIQCHDFAGFAVSKERWACPNTYLQYLQFTGCP